MNQNLTVGEKIMYRNIVGTLIENKAFKKGYGIQISLPYYNSEKKHYGAHARLIEITNLDEIKILNDSQSGYYDADLVMQQVTLKNSYDYIHGFFHYLNDLIGDCENSGLAID